MYPIQRSDYSVSLYTTTTIQYILYNVIIQLWGVITMVNLFLVYFSAILLLLYTTTIQYIDKRGVKRRVKRTLRERLVCVCVCVYILLYTIYYILYSTRERTPHLMNINQSTPALVSIYYYYYIVYTIRTPALKMGGGFYLLYTTTIYYIV